MPQSGATLEINLADPVTTDRLMIQEDQSQGQRIRSYTVEAQIDGSWKQLSSGKSVGNKRIDHFDTITAKTFRLTLAEAAQWPVSVTNFGVFAPCSDATMLTL